MRNRLSDYSFCVLTFVRAPLAKVRDGVDSCLGQFGVNGQFDCSAATLELEAVYVDQPPPGSAHRVVVVAYEPRSNPGCTGLIVNYQDGWSSLIQCLSGRVPGEHLLLQLGSPAMEYPRIAFELFVGGRLKRAVAVWKEEDRWRFWEEGNVENWERPETYQNRTIKTRLTRDALVAAVESTGIDLHEDSFWLAAGDAYYWRRATGGAS